MSTAELDQRQKTVADFAALAQDHASCIRKLTLEFLERDWIAATRGVACLLMDYRL
jgi:hypothetical protein